jgi:RNA polymerase sigma-70 factor, ECF subfamily
MSQRLLGLYRHCCMTLDSPDSAFLIQRTAQKDQTALAQLYDRYAQVLYGVAFASLQSAEESEEVVLDVFAQVWKTAYRYDPTKGRVDTWLFVITRSRILDRLRRRQRSVKATAVLTRAAKVQSMQQLTAVDTEPFLEHREQMLAALQQLPPKQRQVIELAYYQGLSQSEIASHLGVSIGTVKTRVRLGLNKLKTAVLPHRS